MPVFAIVDTVPSSQPSSSCGSTEDEGLRRAWKHAVAGALDVAGHEVVRTSRSGPWWRGEIHGVLIDHPAPIRLRPLTAPGGGKAVPVLVATRPDDPSETASALRAGASDCVPWNSTAEEAVLRLERLASCGVRRACRSVRVGPLLVKVDARRSFLNGSELRLTAIQQTLLVELATRAGATVRSSALLCAAWDDHGDLSEELLRPQISRLRSLLGSSVSITSVRGRGYVLDIESSSR